MLRKNDSFLGNKNVRIAIASMCNLKCIYCEGSSGFGPNKPGAMEDFRRKDLKEGSIDTQTYVAFIKSFYKAGFRGITLTGGEPLLNPDWDLIVSEAAKIGMSRVELTTNGILMVDYLNRKGKLPQGLTLVKISFDTSDPVRFQEITRGGNIEKVINAVRLISPYIKTRANKVLMQSDMGGLLDYLDCCWKIGFREVNLLDLVIYPNRYNLSGKAFFEREYIAFPEVEHYLHKKIGLKFRTRNRYGFELTLPNGLRIIFKDSRLTRRDKQCEHCPIYCQEGKYSIKVATDGSITTCPDYRAELPAIDGLLALEQKTLDQKIKDLTLSYVLVKEGLTIKEFFQRNKIRLAPKIVTPERK